MDVRRRAERFMITMSPEFFRMANIRRGMWHESVEEIEAGLEWGKRKAELLRWVRRQMGRRLTAAECQCVTLYFFHGMTLPEVAQTMGISLPSAHRNVERSLRKLRVTAQRSAQRREARDQRKTGGHKLPSA